MYIYNLYPSVRNFVIADSDENWYMPNNNQQYFNLRDNQG